MTEQQIINHLNSISDLLAALSLGTGKADVQLGYHKDMAEQNRYSLRLGNCTWKGNMGWGPTPAEALADLRKQEAEAEKQDAITAEVERYRAKLEAQARREAAETPGENQEEKAR